VRWSSAALAATLAATPARADPVWTPPDQHASDADQRKADALYNDGIALLAQEAYGPALDKFKAAVALWDHPAIRLNAALTEIELDRVLDAADDLEAALRYGAAPFPAEKYRNALIQRKLLAGRIGTLEVACDQAGAVLLDGKPWFNCPGTQRARLLANEHLIVAEAKGYMTVSRRVVVAGGATAREKLALVPLESVVKLEYPFPRWTPWTTTAVGAAIGIGGIVFWFLGRNEIERFDSQFATDCMAGCSKELNANDVERALASERASAELKGNVGVAMMIVGGVAVIGGATWAILNRPRRVLPAMEVVPTAGGAAAIARWRF